jgi:hypothetical protein
MKSPKSAQWKRAMQKEYNSLIENNTWSMEKLPPGRKLIQNKWVFKLKFKLNGEVDMFKVRLVAKRFT